MLRVEELPNRLRSLWHPRVSLCSPHHWCLYHTSLRAQILRLSATAFPSHTLLGGSGESAPPASIASPFPGAGAGLRGRRRPRGGGAERARLLAPLENHLLPTKRARRALVSPGSSRYGGVYIYIHFFFFFFKGSFASSSGHCVN